MQMRQNVNNGVGNNSDPRSQNLQKKTIFFRCIESMIIKTFFRCTQSVIIKILVEKEVSRNLSIKPKETWSSVTITTQGSAAPIFTFTHFRKNLVSPASIDIQQHV